MTDLFNLVQKIIVKIFSNEYYQQVEQCEVHYERNLQLTYNKPTFN